MESVFGVFFSRVVLVKVFKTQLGARNVCGCQCCYQ